MNYVWVKNLFLYLLGLFDNIIRHKIHCLRKKKYSIGENIRTGKVNSSLTYSLNTTVE